MRNQSSPQWLQTLNTDNNSPLSPFLHTHWPKPIHLPEKVITTTARESSLPTWALWSALDPVSLSGQVSCQFKLPQCHTQTSYMHHLLYFWKDLPRGDLDRSPDQYCLLHVPLYTIITKFHQRTDPRQQHDWLDTLRNSHLSLLKPERKFSPFHDLASDLQSTEHLVCPIYRFWKGWAS